MPPPDRPTHSLPAAAAETAGQDWMHTPSLGGAGSIHAAIEPAEVQLPDYEILGTLGSGGMGVVLQAKHQKLNRIVALKMLHAGPADPEDVIRFRREAEAVARLQHPNIVQIYEIGDLGNGMPFFALEYVSGGSLKDLLKGEPQPPRDAAALVETLARAVEYAHAQGVVHRDLKPANILLQMPHGEGRMPTEETKGTTSGIRPSPFGIPKVTDFGLAKRLDDPTGQTKTGEILGTPSYMAPEQAGLTGDGAVSAAPVGPLVDVYALGAILYELLTGRPPFKGVGAMETIWQVLTEDPVPPTRLQRKVPRDLETICLKCLHKQPERRYKSAGELADDLQRFLRHEPIQARPAAPWERAVHWCKRNPSRALILALAVLAAGRLGYQVWWNQATLATAQAEAEQAKQREQELRTLAWDSLAALAGRGDHEAAATHAERLLDLSSDKDGKLWYQAAAVYARCAQAAPQRLPPYAGRALELLRQAKTAGGISPQELREKLRQDAVWDALRPTPAFLQFLGELP